MSSVGFATLDVIPSMKGLRSRLEQGAGSDFETVGRRGGEKMGDAAAKSAGGRFKAKFSPIISSAFAPVAGLVAGAAVAGFFKDAVSGASDLAETTSKIQVVFGDASTAVQSFASDAVGQLGQTRQQALDAAASFGVFGKAAGLQGDDLSGFSTKLVQLATDMASINNTSVDQAIEAVGAALRGEAEPIRAYGVLLDDATLRQEALRQGLVKTTKEALTPQQKVLAANAVIFQQTADAQGDFARTSGGLAGQQKILTAQFSEMKTELGAKLLPAVTKFVQVANSELIPAVEGAGGAVADAAGAFGSLPTPVKAAAGALVAFRIAQATGITTSFVSGVGTLGKGLQDVRLRATVAAEEFTKLRSGTLELNGQVGKLTPGVGRLNASLGAIRSSAAGAGSALKRGIGGAVGLLGGPWGIAFAVATVAVTHFWQQQQKAAAHAAELRESLNLQTGAVTKNTRAVVANLLEQEGVLEKARALGVNLQDVTAAALGNAAAQERLNNVLRESIRVDEATGRGTAVRTNGLFALLDAVGSENTVLQGQIETQKRVAEASGDAAAATKRNADATNGASGALRTYASSIAEARGELKQLMAAEDKRRLKIIQDRRDQIALRETIRAAREEARKGKHVLDDGTKAADDNMSALLDLAEQWNQSTPKVQNARGAYKHLRDEFIDLGDQMNGPNGTRKDAEKLAEALLKVPKNTPVRFQSEGFQELEAQIAHLRAISQIQLTVHANRLREQTGDAPKFASGGKVGGSGQGDTRLIWADPREWVINPSAVAYYGDDFMSKVNNRQIPRVEAVHMAPPTSPGGGSRTSGGGTGDLRITGTLQTPFGPSHIEGIARETALSEISDSSALNRTHDRMYVRGQRG